MVLAVVSLLTLNYVLAAEQHLKQNPQYRTLPPLREQAALQDGWRQERIHNIPLLLQKYGADAWLV